MDVDIPPAKRATRKEHVPDALPVEGQRIEHALLLQAFLEQNTAVRPFPLLHKNLPFNAEFISLDAKTLCHHYTPNACLLQQAVGGTAVGPGCGLLCGYYCG